MTIQAKAIFDNTGHIFWTLTGAIFVLLFAYLSLLTITVSDVVARQNGEHTLSAIYSSVGELESTYLSHRNKVTLDTARSLGYADVTHIDFVSAAQFGNRFTLSTGR